jgi:hypothetical protein
MFFVVLWVHSRVCVMPDAFSTAIGATLGVAPMDDLMNASKLTRDGSKYRLAP